MDVIIIGGGIGGLTAAAAVAPFSKTVIVVERDDAPTAKSPRRYAPQGAHIHILLQAGLNILNDLLPGIRQQLVSGGSSEINAGTGQQIFEYGAWRPSRVLDMTYLGQSRLHLETTLHQRVQKIKNVNIVKNVVSELKVSGTGQVVGVNLKNGPTSLLASIVIDASGMAGAFCRWFKNNNITTVDIDTFPINIFYSTIHFKKPEKFWHAKENILIVPEAGVSNLGGSLLDIENNTWCVSLHGRDGEQVPRTMEAWRDMVKNLPDARIWERIEHAEALNDITYFKKAKAIWRRFDTCENLPEGYLPLGDTINSLNPIFGQGMTVAIGHAEALFNAAKAQGLQSNQAFQALYLEQAMQWTSAVWKKSAAFDKNFFSTTSADKKRIDLIRKFTAAQHKKISESEAFHLKLVEDAQMLN